MASKTISFDNKNRFWKSEYTYSTTCFGNINKKFISFSQTSGTGNNQCWKHEDNSPLNNFYGGNTETSSIGVSFNDNVSTNKIYKSLSIEGSRTSIGSPDLNIFRANSDNERDKISTLGAVTEKGGILYGHVGNIGRNTSSNINVVGKIEDVLNLPIEAQYTDIDGDYNTSSFWKKFVIKNGNFSNVSKNSRFFILKADGGYLSITSAFVNAWVFDSGSPLSYYGVPVESIDNAYTPQGDGENYLVKDGIIINGANGSAALYNLLNANQELILCSVSPSNINGEQPKGQYAESFFIMNPGIGKGFEINAFNLNYEVTDLDHSK